MCPCKGRLQARGNVTGAVYTKTGKAMYTIEGNVVDYVFARPRLGVPESTSTASASASSPDRGLLAGGKPIVNGGARGGVVIATPSSSWNAPAGVEGKKGGQRGEVAWGEPIVLFRRNPPPDDFYEQYCMTRFAITLNDPSDPLVLELPPTDSRFRPDQRALESGEHSKATSEKLRLEEKQRHVR